MAPTPSLISHAFRLCFSSKIAFVLRLVLGCAAFALVVFTYICYWTMFATGLSPQAEEFRDTWDSCVTQRAGHLFKLNMLSDLHSQKCTDLVEAAVAKGEALMARGRDLRERGEAEHQVADGCTVTYDARADPWDNHPLPPNRFSQSGSCLLEWVIYSSECGVNMVRLADFAHMAGISFSIIGSRQPWTGQGGRLRAIRDFLAALPRDRVVITTDADDVFLMPHPRCRPQNFLDAFFALNAPVVFGAEIFCWPDWKKLEPYFPHKRDSSVNRFLNAGAYGGYAWAVAEIIDLIYVRDCMQDQRGFILAFLAQQYLFRDMPRAPNPDPSAVRAAWESPSDVAEAVRAQAEAAESASRAAWRNNRTVQFDSAMSPFHRLPAKPKQRVMDEARRAGHRGAAAVMAAPFMKLDHYSSLFMHLGGLNWDNFTILGTGEQALVRQPTRPHQLQIVLAAVSAALHCALSRYLPGWVLLEVTQSGSYLLQVEQRKGR
ncbi:unnamed protein product [Closterium sp. Naga37s-1]|nr:unnamed protein product [Closterium sp. Naga37s-1]